MSLQASHQNFVSSSSLSPWLPVKPFRVYLVVGSDHCVFNHCCTWMRGHTRISYVKLSRKCKLTDLGKKSSSFPKVKRIDRLLDLASVDDGVTVNSKPQPRTGDDIGGMYKLDESLQGEDYKTGLVQLLHDAARVFELAIKEQNMLSKTSWFSIAWLGEDKNVWVKALSYQAAVYSLLQAASEISSRGDGRDRDVNVFLRMSISRQSAPLETVINDKLLGKQPEACDWFWSEKTPELVTSFVNYLDKEQCLAPANAVHKKGFYEVSGNSSDISLLLLALSCIAAIMKLGPTKVFCTQFFSIVSEIIGRLMDMLVEFVPLGQAYNSIKGMGLRREFLIHFGPRAAACRVKNELGAEEIVFWVGLVQKQLQRAIDLERIWSRLTTSESIEVLERDLAIFGFFIALGRSTQSYLFANGFETMDEPIDGFIRYLIAGSVLYYPQLSAISSYQLYVEVVCEELDWVLFYPGSGSTSKRTIGPNHNKSPPSAEAIPLVLDVCSHWIESFIKYSKWPANPSNVKAARFLSKGYNKLKTCMEQLGISKDHSAADTEAKSFDKALDNVEGALLRLEELLQELYVSSTNSRKEYLKAACSDLERIRRLKKETEFLEASFRAKAASLQQEAVSGLRTPVGEQQPYSRGKDSKGSDAEIDRGSSSHGLWSFFVRQPNKSPTRSALAANDSTDGIVELEITDNKSTDSESDEIQRFELLRSELMELEKRVQRSADRCDEEEVLVKVDASIQNDDAKVSGSVPNLKVHKKDNIIGKSLDKLKETSIDVLQGTQLLAIDTAAAMGLLRRVLIGDEVTEKEKQALRRTLTDLASVLPIGFLMLLPVTAVGHAAMLAAIQRYMPALIPSTYGAERLDLLRQLEKVREMEDDMATDEHLDEE